MKAVILVAGASRRLRPLTEDTPKCLLSVAGKPILGRMIDGLLAAGIKNFVIVTGYLEDRVRQAVDSWYPGLDAAFVTNPHYDATNTSASLLLARPFVAGQSFLLLDGDIVGDMALGRVLLESRFSDCLALRPADDLGDEEVKAELDGERRVVRIGKPNVPLKVAAGESIGIEKISPAFGDPLFRALHELVEEQNGGNELREVAYQHIIDDGATMYAVDVGDYFCTEIDTPADLEQASRELRERGL